MTFRVNPFTGELDYYEVGSQGPQGDQGTQGVAGAQGNQGNQGVAGGSMSWLGAWALTTEYAADDAVENDGSSYICILGHTSGADNEPGVGVNWETYWSLFAQKGAQGAQGAQGTTGDAGEQGAQGNQGNQGAAGAQGTQGTQGDTGETGAQGSQGNQGNQGTQGAQGTQGTQGVQGATGDAGPQGDTGSTGAQGNQGNQGASGAQGSQGNQGDAGAAGPQGTQGNQGAAGSQGNQGDTGAAGPQGDTGETGAQGTQGSAGAQGNQGNQGTQGTQGTQGNQGYQGTQGDQGYQGDPTGAYDGLPDTDHTATGPQTNTFAAGATITIMDLCYLGSASKWLLTDADAAASASGFLAISLESKTDTQAMNVALPGSFVRDDTWNWTPGAPLYIDTTTAGAIVASQPTGTDDVIRVVGWAVSADVIYFMPESGYITHT